MISFLNTLLAAITSNECSAVGDFSNCSNSSASMPMGKAPVQMVRPKALIRPSACSLPPTSSST